MIRFRLHAIALTLLGSTSAWADLKTYDVDPQYQQEVFAALKNVLNPEGIRMEANGRVEQLPSGQILVNANAETLAQVEQVLQAIRTRSVAAAPRVALRYWGVLGARAKDGTADMIAAPPPAALNEVLSELKRLHGDLTFRVLGTAAVATNSGQYGEIKGTTLSVGQTAHVQGDTLNAEISMEVSTTSPPPMVGPFKVGELQLRTTLRRGEFVVLGEGQLEARGLEGAVFYIVHWAEE